jgi:hypothetical protein
MFAKLSEVLATGLVIDFTLTRTTLEQVFINFAKFQVGSDIQGNANGISHPYQPYGGQQQAYQANNQGFAPTQGFSPVGLPAQESQQLLQR